MLKSLFKAISTKSSSTPTVGGGRIASTTGDMSTKVAKADCPCDVLDTPEKKLNHWIKAGYWVCVTVKEVSLC